MAPGSPVEFRGPAPGRVDLTFRRALLLTAAFVLAAGSSALAVEVQPGEVEAKFDARFSPQHFSPSKPAPVSPWVSMRFRTPGYSRVPALKEFEIEEDRRLRLNLKGVPVGRRGSIDKPPPAEQGCKTALIGKGKVEVYIPVPEGIPIMASSEVTVYNAGVHHGVRTLFLTFFLTVPTPKEIVSTIAVKKAGDSRYGLKLVGSDPEVAGGFGSITSLAWRFHKSVFSATCPAGHLNTGFATTFVDGTHLLGKVTRPCTPVP
jgi:hypothetical protein